ncbi:hypothetical protein NQ318_015316 [Aromia moschata]|uniref:Uncharacterized protein n=1 Tax=Aromia moschata TaxID=1265417 RepID=A0AAV8XX58_9CUCU|nr:hypothetical protein NQ318_015316 [Aromia moschata]
MEKTLEQRYPMKFCVKLNKTPKDIYDMLKDAFGDIESGDLAMRKICAKLVPKVLKDADAQKDSGVCESEKTLKKLS